VISLLENADDDMLNEIKVIINGDSNWGSLPENLKLSILKGSNQISNGQFKTDDVIMEKYKKWIGK
jgi:hypothetical protein